MLSAASRPSATAVTVRSSPPVAQSPPAQTFAIEVRPSASTSILPPASVTPSPSVASVWPMALNTWSQAMIGRLAGRLQRAVASSAM